MAEEGAAGGTPANFVEARGLLPWWRMFVYVDRKSWVADRVFARHRLPVRFGRHFEREGSPYVLVSAWVRRSRREEFVACMGELRRDSLLRDGGEYAEACRQFAEVMGDDA